MSRKLERDVQLFVHRVENQLDKAGHSGGLEALTCRFLMGKDLKVAAFVWAKLLSYKYGLPKQTVQVAGEVKHTMTAEDRKEANEAIQKLLGPGSETIEVEGKEVVN
jgi:hypothetical protein